MSILKKLAGDTALYGISTIGGRLLNWLLVIVHTRIFEQPRQLSDNNQLYVYAILLNIVYTYGMETAFFRFGSKKEDRQEYYNLILSSIIITSLVFSALFITFATPLINLLGYAGKERLIIWFAIILATDAVSAIAFVKLRAENRAKKFVTIKLVNIFVNVGLNIFYLLFCKLIYEGKFLSDWYSFATFFYKPNVGPDYIVWANLIASLITLLMLWREFITFKFTINWQAFKPVLIYAYPLMIMGLAGNINLTADRLLFRSLLPDGFYAGLSTDDAFGIYSNVYKLSIFMTLVVQAYRYAADPFFFSKADSKNSPAINALATKWFTIACIFIWVGVSLNLDLISLIIGKSYRSGIVVVPILLLANLFIGLYGNLGIWFKLTDKTHYGTWFTIIGMTITVILNIILIPVWGYIGCGITFAFSSFLMVVACYYYGQKYYPIPYPVKTLLTYLFAAGVLIFTNYQFPLKNGISSKILYMLETLVFFAIILWYELKVKTMKN